MATPRFAWGIDVGNRALKAVKLTSTADGLVIDDFDVIEHETVLSEAGDNRDSLVQTALANFVARHPGIDKGQIGVGVTGQQSFARFIKLPPVEPKKIPEIVRFEAIQQIPFPLDEVEWSYQLFQDPESPEVEVGIFAMRKDLINSHIKFFTDANLNVQVVQMNPLSVYNAMYYDSRIKGTTMIIDVGAENTDLIIAEGETIWLRSISIGGNNFTEALTKAFKVNFVKAEDLKRNASTSKYGRQIMQAMRPIFADLVSEIQRSIGFYSSVHKESRINKVLAVGSTFRLPGLQKYLSQNLTLDVDKLDRLSTGAIEDPKIAASFSENLLSAAGAYGLALQVMGQGKIGSSLLPETIRRDKMWAEKSKWFIAAAALFVVGAMVPYARWYLESSSFKGAENQGLVDQISDVKNKATRAENDWSKVEQTGTAEKQIMLNVMGLADGKNLWPQIDTLLYNTLPQNGDGKQPELGSSDLDTIKKIPRNQRNQIIILGEVARYVADMSTVIGPGLDISSHADLQAVSAIPFENGGAGDSFGQRSDSGYQPSPDQTAAAPAAKPERGFIVTLKLSTPSDSGVLIVQKFNDALQALTATADRPVEIRQAKIVRQSRIKDDPTRLQALVTDYQNRLKAKAQPLASPPAGGGFNGGGFNGGGFNGGGSSAEHFKPGAVPISTPPDSGYSQPGFAGGNSTVVIPPEAYQDPVLKEDVRDDTECIVVMAVVVDPNPSTTAPGGAPAAKTVAVATPGGPGQP
jgi:type IV pilus assembly protein PilM